MSAVPIKPENRARYPTDWPEIVEQVRERSGDCCEGSPGFYPDCRARNGEPHPVTSSIVVLTVAHLDHMPENCQLANLLHMCQRCHLTYDAQHHAETAYATRREGKAARDLFDGCDICGGAHTNDEHLANDDAPLDRSVLAAAQRIADRSTH